MVEEIEATGGRGRAVSGDVTDRSTANDLAEAAASLGDLAALVNNAGTPGEANAQCARDSRQPLGRDDPHQPQLGPSPDECPRSAHGEQLHAEPIHRAPLEHGRAQGLARYGAYCVSKAAVERLTNSRPWSSLATASG